MQKLLTANNTKIKKGEKKGFMTFGMHLAPANQSGFNVCPSASEGCKLACLATSGHGRYARVQSARVKKTLFFFKEREKFMAQLVNEISAAIRKAKKNGMKPCFRLNLTSDLAWEKIKYQGNSIFELFPMVKFYDYTAIPSRMAAFLAGELPKNYHLTFSRKESNDLAVQAVIASGGNVAVVFRGALPKTWNGKRVVSGDNDDIRFKDPRGVIVGLVEKGRAKQDKSGFVLEPKQ